MKKFTPLGPNIVIKADVSEKISQGGIIYAAEGTRESQAQEFVEIVAVGESANDDLVLQPKVGDMVAIARYDGVLLDTTRDGNKTYQYRVIADNRIRAIITEVVL